MVVRILNLLNIFPILDQLMHLLLININRIQKLLIKSRNILNQFFFQIFNRARLFQQNLHVQRLLNIVSEYKEKLKLYRHYRRRNRQRDRPLKIYKLKSYKLKSYILKSYTFKSYKLKTYKLKTYKLKIFIITYRDQKSQKSANTKDN